MLICRLMRVDELLLQYIKKECASRDRHDAPCSTTIDPSEINVLLVDAVPDAVLAQRCPLSISFTVLHEKLRNRGSRPTSETNTLWLGRVWCNDQKIDAACIESGQHLHWSSTCGAAVPQSPGTGLSFQQPQWRHSL